MRGMPQIERQVRALPNPVEKHTCDSKWQFCNCRTCQEYRMLIESMPGKPMDFATYRHKDERY